MYIGPDDVLVTLDLDFADGTSAAEAGAAITTTQREVRARFPMIKRIFIESGSAPLAPGEADAMRAEVNESG